MAAALQRHWLAARSGQLRDNSRVPLTNNTQAYGSRGRLTLLYLLPRLCHGTCRHKLRPPSLAPRCLSWVESCFRVIGGNVRLLRHRAAVRSWGQVSAHKQGISPQFNLAFNLQNTQSGIKYKLNRIKICNVGEDE